MTPTLRKSTSVLGGAVQARLVCLSDPNFFSRHSKLSLATSTKDIKSNLFRELIPEWKIRKQRAYARKRFLYKHRYLLNLCFHEEDFNLMVLRVLWKGKKMYSSYTKLLASNRNPRP